MDVWCCGAAMNEINSFEQHPSHDVTRDHSNALRWVHMGLLKLVILKIHMWLFFPTQKHFLSLYSQVNTVDHEVKWYFSCQTKSDYIWTGNWIKIHNFVLCQYAFPNMFVLFFSSSHPCNVFLSKRRGSWLETKTFKRNSSCTNYSTTTILTKGSSISVILCFGHKYRKIDYIRLHFLQFTLRWLSY